LKGVDAIVGRQLKAVVTALIVCVVSESLIDDLQRSLDPRLCIEAMVRAMQNKLWQSKEGKPEKKAIV
jgi:hypothetical protein